MSTENLDAPNKEAFQYWGYLFNPDKSCTSILDRLLTGIWNFISKNYEPNGCPDITPSQLAAFYRSVGGDYDILFVQSQPSAVQFIYKSLGALHSLQPDPKASGYADPHIPALNKKGYITWQTIQLLLLPGEHGPFLQHAVSQFEIIDPETNQPFPKLLPSQSFPRQPDEEMVHWYDNVSERLRKEAAATEQQHRTAAHVSSDVSEESSADERTTAAEYFRNPQYRNREGRPTIIRRFSSKPRSPREYVQDRTRAVAHTVRHLVNPWGRRRGSLPEKYEEEDPEFEDERTPTVHTRYAHRRPHARRQESYSSSDSEDDVRPRVSPRIRHRRSHEVPPSPREYFPPYYESSRRYSGDPRAATERGPSSDTHPATNGSAAEAGYVPSNGPLFATQVAQMQPHLKRPQMPSRGSYARSTPSRYSAHETSPRESVAPSTRDPQRYDYSSRSSSRNRSGRSSRDVDRERERERDKDGDRERPRVHRYVTPVDGVGGRKYAVDQPWRC